MIVVIQCRDQIGLVAAITGVLARQGLNIVSLREHVDPSDNRFFIRIEVDGETPKDHLLLQLTPLLPGEAIISINPQPEKKIVVLVTKEYHCLSDILIRNHFKTLGASVQHVIGNYPAMEDICRRFEIPFTHISHEQLEKAIFEQQIMDILLRLQPDYIVLAKFMRILSPDFVKTFPARIINIHHSFLPAFVGANPYRQAFDRGVKLIGATAHFVTDQLDEGPIIAQQTIPVNHSYTAAAMMKAGKEIETSVLGPGPPPGVRRPGAGV
ncbi:formyltetrahydrofolate deformylase [Puia sp. P3]|uniref:formyltetrahydrofolate deformylase n=1 Tax=Puia sp. P3 TaxID=3423952 RepID=UPI003D66740E